MLKSASFCDIPISYVLGKVRRLHAVCRIEVNFIVQERAVTYTSNYSIIAANYIIPAERSSIGHWPLPKLVQQTLTRLPLHLVRALPTRRIPVPGRSSRIFWIHRPLVLQAKFHCHFCDSQSYVSGVWLLKHRVNFIV